MNELQRLARATRISLTGLNDAFVNESAFRLEVILLVTAMPLGAWIASDVGQFIGLIGVLVLLMVVELLNSAVEAAIDRIGPERHELSKNAKDYGSAAVFLAALLSATVWGHAVWSRWA